MGVEPLTDLAVTVSVKPTDYTDQLKYYQAPPFCSPSMLIASEQPFPSLAMIIASEPVCENRFRPGDLYTGHGTCVTREYQALAYSWL